MLFKFGVSLHQLCLSSTNLGGNVKLSIDEPENVEPSIVCNFDSFSNSILCSCLQLQKAQLHTLVTSRGIVMPSIDELTNVETSIACSFILSLSSIRRSLHLEKAFFFYSCDFSWNRDALERRLI